MQSNTLDLYKRRIKKEKVDLALSLVGQVNLYGHPFRHEANHHHHYLQEAYNLEDVQESPVTCDHVSSTDDTVFCLIQLHEAFL